MAQGYRSLRKWNQWLLEHHLGASLMRAETLWLQQLLQQQLRNHFGAQALLIGVPNQNALLRATTITTQTLISPFAAHAFLSEHHLIEADFRELPIQSGSVDLVLLPHILERIDSPRQVLNEACRVLKPEGLIVIAGFRPYGWWDVKQRLAAKQSALPWFGHYIPMRQIEHWLTLADFAFVNHHTFFLRPPIEKMTYYEKLTFLEKCNHPAITSCLTWLSNAYIVCARAKVLPLTPIKFKLRWKPALPTMPATLIGHGFIENN